MALFIFKYALPALLGYTLFVGIAGRFNPGRQPTHLEERPSWILGLWTGMSVFLVLSIGLHMAYGMTLGAARSLATPIGISTALVLIFGFIGYSGYRKSVAAELESNDIHVGNSHELHINRSEKVHQLDLIIENRAPTLALLSDVNATTSMQKELEKEKVLRKETERHLRITRKALSTMHEMNLVDTDEHRALNALGLSVANLKRELVKAKHEIRLHVSARAKALSTANKSVAFARQSIELRARLETELETAHSALSNRQATIASLISRLERERRLTDDELAALAKHFTINEPKIKSDISDQANTDFERTEDTRFTNGS
jgi:hypothetical protein